MPEPHASLQRKLLETEGVVIDGRAIDMERYGWSPLKKTASARKRRRTKPR
jgi:hypothetical protein